MTLHMRNNDDAHEVIICSTSYFIVKQSNSLCRQAIEICLLKISSLGDRFAWLFIYFRQMFCIPENFSQAAQRD